MLTQKKNINLTIIIPQEIIPPLIIMNKYKNSSYNMIYDI